MDINEQLAQLADRYRSLGFDGVVVRPGPQDLPCFAQDFQVEIVARREDGGVLASAKSSAAEVEVDPNLSRYAEITAQQPGWRFDLFVLGPETLPVAEHRSAREPSPDEIRKSLEDVERLLQAGFVNQAFTASWAAMESALRRRLRAAGEQAGWGTSPRTMLGELYSSGVLSTQELRQLEASLQLRNAIAHGFAAPAADSQGVHLLVEAAQQLLAETQLVKQPA